MEYKLCSSCIPESGALTGYYKPGQLSPGHDNHGLIKNIDYLLHTIKTQCLQELVQSTRDKHKFCPPKRTTVFDFQT
ncbi:hypothetical protein LAZ67_11002905 [Cordylochernes scorpioides]|uniref:Uncharacterized protein n=1 Tax=Cordylochernes scorpioides TaxID=51811 RepID=A0ABY6L4D5_9ARAC|nr:hypothetical protein LAZ67_11002905 [Cordylochernes scorpioides]